MNASILKRTLAIAAAIAVPWIGCSLWSARRERVEKEALAAEIRAEMAARPPEPDWSAGRQDLTAEYAKVLAGLGYGTPVNSEELLNAVQSKEPWGAVPPAVAAALEAHAESLVLLDTLVEGTRPGTFEMGQDWNPWNRLGHLILARGRSQVAARDWDGLLRTVRAMRKVADDFLASSGPSNPFFPAVFASVWETRSVELMEEAAVHPHLPAETASACLALASGPGVRPRAWDVLDGHFRKESDQFVLDLLGDDPEEALRRHGLVDDDTMLKRAERLVGGKDREGRVMAPPPASVLRRMREISARIRDAKSRRQGESSLPDGDLIREARRDLGGGWMAIHLSAGPPVGRAEWMSDDRRPVLRAALAIRIHESCSGRLPESLDELVPSVLDAVPVDAWTGRPVTYTRKPGGGWILEAGPPKATIDQGEGEVEETESHRLEKK